MKAFSEIERNLLKLIESAPTLVAEALKAEAESLRSTVDAVERTRQQLNIIECSMRILLQLLDEADEKQLVSFHLHCLLTPIRVKLLEAITSLDSSL